MKKNDAMTSPCGLNCGVCDIHLAPENEELAEGIASWIRDNFDPKCTAEMIHCAGCPGYAEREDHWSPDCWIMECCVDKKGLRYCSRCGDFPCSGLKEWATRSDKYEKALENLRRMARQ
ncbi:MAG: DUF3795 domain-containing protein [Candidatus Aegiribacteria sp.]|nr:DUF3795 domain-containing protein [Candidatus Aegiribacteria sp.]MBD3295100.1 DUF3795 domain-containing protein [Candidatus Fermentibacteria bacterium]